MNYIAADLEGDWIERYAEQGIARLELTLARHAAFQQYLTRR